MTEKMLKCNHCKNKFPKSSLKQATQTIRLCESCFKQREEKMKNQNELYATIKELYCLDYVTPLLRKQIKDFQEQYGFTLQGINLTLQYCKFKPNITFDSSIGLGIVPYMYEEAKKDFLRKKQLKEHMEQNNTIQKTKKITINIKAKNKYLEKKLINLEEI